MTNKELHTLVNAAQGGKLKPTPKVWDRLESRLESNVKDQTIKRLTLQKTLLAVASCVLIAAIAVVSLSSDQTINESVNYSSLAKSPQTPSTLYDVHNVRKLNRIYN